MTQDRKPVGLMAAAFAVFRKELQTELRDRAALNATLLFSVAGLAIVAYGVGPAVLPAVVQSALLWVVLFFAAFSGLAHVFTHEEEAGTSAFLRLTADAHAVYLGKLLFNLLLTALIALITVPAGLVAVSASPDRPWVFAAVALAGVLALATSATVVAAIIARAQGRGALFGAVGLPLLLPVLLIAVDATKNTLEPEMIAGLAGREILGLCAFAVMVIAASWLVFPAVWEE